MDWTTDIQANILRGLPADQAEYRFLHFVDGHAMQRFIRRVLPLVRDAAWQRDQFSSSTALMAHPVLNLAFTRHGIELVTGPGSYQSDDERRYRLDPAAVLLTKTSDAFARRDRVPTSGQPGAINLGPDVENSMYRRLDILGEAPINGVPHSWSRDWLYDPPALPNVPAVPAIIHALAWISGPRRAGGIGPTGQLAADAAQDPDAINLARLALTGERNADRTDPFGYVDGVVQPAIEGFHSRREVMGRGAWTASGWRGLAPGELIVGQEDEGGERRRPQPGDVLDGCTFLAFRQIQMWPQRFFAFLDEQSGRLGVPREMVAGWLMGRHPRSSDNDGTSLMIEGPREDRDFIYGFDPEGERCPLGAHIRRANPLDSMGKNGNKVNRHRIVRRGMPYRLADGTTGPAFIALQARIEDQFEFIQAHWLNAGSTLHEGPDHDAVAGVKPADVDDPRFVKRGSPAALLPLPAQPFTAVRGGEYFVMPSLPGLHALATIEVP
jgi:hypothetical protein